MKTRTITVGFSTPRMWNAFSALTAWWFGVKYSHVYLQWSTPWGFDEILQASENSLHMIEKSRWSRKNKVIKEYTFEVSKQQFNRVMIEIRKDAGTPYGRRQLLGLALMELFKLKNNPLADGKRSLVCSDVALRFVRIMGFNIYKLQPERVTPKDVETILKGAK